MIELNDVYFAYPEKPVLSGIDLHIRRGEYLGITGDNGSGKTALAKLLNGLLIPCGGKITVNGRSTATPISTSAPTTCDPESLLAIRRSVGIVFQNPDAQAIGETVEEDIVFGLENIGIPKSEIDRRINRYLDLLGIGDLRYKNIALLSGGQKQLVNLAAVMAMEPECIVFDEALSMLDPTSRRNALDAISELNRDHTAVILITHNHYDLCNCSRVIRIAEGRITSWKLPEYGDEAIENHKLAATPTHRRTPSHTHTHARPHTLTSAKVARSPQKIPGIEIVHVSHTYNPGTDWAVPALKNIDLRIEKGRVFGIIGGIGSGKSTLASLIAGLDTPTTGSVTIDGIPPEPGKNAGILFQHPEDFFFEKTVREDMAFGLRKTGLSENAIDRKIRSTMDAVGLDSGIFEKSPFHLSSGERRLVSFGCVIASAPDYLVLDEPTAGLDQKSRRGVLEVISGVACDLTVVYISHRVRDVLDISERIAVLDDGVLAFTGMKDQYSDWR